MSTMLVQKFRDYKKGLGIIAKSQFKQRYGSKYFPVDNQGRMFLCVTVMSNINSAADTIASWGGSIHAKGSHEIYAWIPIEKLSDLSKLSGVTFIDGVGQSVARTGDVTSVGDGQLLADSARSVFYSDGTGVRVGVLSTGAQYYSQTQQYQDLPSSITFVPSTTTGYDGSHFIGAEGTAMMEIVHDLAPGAALSFGGVGKYINSYGDTVQTGPLDMQYAINQMASGGCKVIVDDMGWIYNDPWFEDGYDVSSAVYNFQQGGGTYVSAAGNDNGQMYSGKPSISPVGTKHWVEFNGTDTTLTFTLSNYTSFDVTLQWDDEWNDAQADYNLWLYDANWNLIDSSNFSGSGSGVHPEEHLAWGTNGYFSNATFHVMVDYANYYSGRNLNNIKVGVFPQGAGTNPSFQLTNGSSSGQIYGQTAAPNVISVAAYPASNQNTIESFSSRGPSLMFPYLNPAAEANRNTPVITATDGVHTYVGEYLQEFEDPFNGTSAAAPHVAAIAALYYSRYPSQGTSQFVSAMTSSAKSIAGGTGGSWNQTSGYGKIDAYDAIVKGLTTLNSPNVTSNTTWDLDHITGTATISSGVSVTVDANQTTLVDGTVNFADQSSRILIYGTLILSSSASVNYISSLIKESGGRLISPNLVSVSVNQLDASNNPFGTVGRWVSGAWDSTAVPYNFNSFAGTPEHMRAQQYFKSGTTQKFQLWNQTNAKIINPDTFMTRTGIPNNITANFQTANDATVQSLLIDGGSSAGTVNFLDPWFIDTTDTYGPRNQGMLDWARPVSNTLNDIGTGTTHQGVFLNQPYGGTSPYYSVGFLPNQTISVGGTNHSLYLVNWNGNSATIQNSIANQTGVEFTSSNATVTANVKGNLLSSVSSASGYGNQSSIIKDDQGNLDMVYASAGEIWYTKSTDDGQTWEPEVRISVGDGYARNPSIAQWYYNPSGYQNPYDLCVVWVDAYQSVLGFSYTVFCRYLQISSNSWDPIEVVDDPSSGGIGYAKSNSKPAASLVIDGGYQYTTIAFEGVGTGILLMTQNPYGNWYSSTLTSDTTCENPDLFTTDYPSLRGFLMYVTYDNGYNIYMQYATNPAPNSGTPSFGSPSTVNSGIECSNNTSAGITVDGAGTVRFSWRGFDPLYAYQYAIWERSLSWAGWDWSSPVEIAGYSSLDEPSICGHVNSDYGATIMFHDEVSTNPVYEVFSNNGGASWSGGLANLGTEITSNAAYPNLLSTSDPANIPFVITTTNTTPYALEPGMRNDSTGTGTLYKQGANGSILRFSQVVQVVDTTNGLSAAFHLSNMQLSRTGMATVFGKLMQTSQDSSRRSIIRISPSLNGLLLSNAGANLTFNGNLVVKRVNGSASVALELVDSASNTPFVNLVEWNVVDSVRHLADSSFSVGIPLGILARNPKLAVLVNGKPDTTARLTLVNVYFLDDTSSSNGGGYVPASVPLPTDYSLSQNYPNPFNPTTVIEFRVPSSGFVSLKIYDVLGRNVATLVNERQNAGDHSVTFNASNLPSGVYFYRLTAGDFSKTKKMILAK